MSQVIMVNGVARCSSNLEFIEKRVLPPAETQPHDGGLVSSEIISTPNGMHYGKDGHIPCSHTVRFVYTNVIKTFDGIHTTAKRKPAPDVLQRVFA